MDKDEKKASGHQEKNRPEKTRALKGTAFWPRLSYTTHTLAPKRYRRAAPPRGAQTIRRDEGHSNPACRTLTRTQAVRARRGGQDVPADMRQRATRRSVHSPAHCCADAAPGNCMNASDLAFSDPKNAITGSLGDDLQIPAITHQTLANSLAVPMRRSPEGAP